MDEVDEALSSDQLINVQVDYQSIRDVLSELTVQLDRANHSILDLQQHRELDALLNRLDKMEEHVQQLSASRDLASDECGPSQTRKVEETIDRKFSELENRFRRILDEQKSSGDTKSRQQEGDTIQYVTLQAFNALLNRVNDLDGALREKSVPVTVESKTPPSDAPAGLSQTVELLKRRVADVENEDNEWRKTVRELEKNLEALSSRVNGGEVVRSREIESPEEKDLRTMIVKEVVPELEKLRARNRELESQVQEQSKVIKELQGNGQRGFAVGDNEFTDGEDDRDRINKIRLNGRRASHQMTLTPGRGLARSDSTPASVLLNSGERLQGTPTGHTSFKQLSNHVNDIEQKFADVENKLHEMEEKFALLMGLSSADPGDKSILGEDSEKDKSLHEDSKKDKSLHEDGKKGKSIEEDESNDEGKRSKSLHEDGGEDGVRKSGKGKEHDLDEEERHVKRRRKGESDGRSDEEARNRGIDEDVVKAQKGDEKEGSDEEADQEDDEGEHGTDLADDDTAVRKRKHKGTKKERGAHGEGSESQHTEDDKVTKTESRRKAKGSKNVTLETKEVETDERSSRVDRATNHDNEEDNAKHATYSDEYEYDNENDDKPKDQTGEGGRKRGKTFGGAKRAIPRPPVKKNESGKKVTDDDMSSLSEERIFEDFTVEDIGKLIHDVRLLQRHVRRLTGEMRRLRGEEPQSNVPALGEDPSAEKHDQSDAELDSGRMDSEPETGERGRRMELRVDTPGSEDKSGRRTPQRSLTPGSAAIQKGVSKLEDSLREMQERYSAVQERLGKLTEEMRETQARAQQKDAENEVTDKLKQDIEQLRVELDQRLLGLTPQMIQEMGTYAPLPVVKKIAVNFQRSVDELERQVGSIRDFLKNLVSKNDLEAAIDQIQLEGSKGETAGGRLGIRCLLCGKPANGVTGMIMESEVARMLGPPPQCGVTRGRGCDSLVLTYGRGPVKPANWPSPKKPLPPMKPLSELSSSSKPE